MHFSQLKNIIIKSRIIYVTNKIDILNFAVSRLYEDNIAQVGRELYQNKSKSPQAALTNFMAYLRNVQLKGYLLWAVGLGT